MLFLSLPKERSLGWPVARRDRPRYRPRYRKRGSASQSFQEVGALGGTPAGTSAGGSGLPLPARTSNALLFLSRAALTGGSTAPSWLGSTVPPTMEPNISRGDKDEDEYEEEDWVVSLRDKEEIKELKAQVTSLKNDLVKSHEGKCKLDKMLSVQQSPNDKSGLGFNSNNKNKSKSNKIKKGQLQVKDPAKIVCFKCKIEGHHVRSCPLKKKQKGKRPQAQTHIQPQVEEMPLPKKKQANAPIVEKSSEKKEKKRTCYICREKGHISSFCYRYLIQLYHH
ncbi:hypothetical protein QYE76_034249 [Lolium multiflorum]|uniref:CCHC-type domain-containing protein n=1 Tax=Lolium multiflorum TaxID=4521 RepID=A0AAD8QXC0_LOLMU|nr:hypothetical protein QYE76_034249 [Lolium multiflorum]